MKAALGEAVDSLMCTSSCPCDKTAFDTKYAAYTAAELSPFNRSPEKDASATNKLVVAGATGAKYTTWGDCYNATLKAQAADGKTFAAKSKDFKDFMTNGGVQFLGSLEDSFDCAGLCYTPLFYLKKSIALGKPTEDCARAVVNKIGSNTAVGGITIVTGLVFFTAFLGSIPLCRGFHAQGDTGKAF